MQFYYALCAAELKILLVYSSESLGRLGQNGGGLLGPYFSWGGRGPPGPPVEPPLYMSDLQ